MFPSGSETGLLKYFLHCAWNNEVTIANRELHTWTTMAQWFNAFSSLWQLFAPLPKARMAEQLSPAQGLSHEGAAIVIAVGIWSNVSFHGYALPEPNALLARRLLWGKISISLLFLATPCISFPPLSNYIHFQNKTHILLNRWPLFFACFGNIHNSTTKQNMATSMKCNW